MSDHAFDVCSCCGQTKPLPLDLKGDYGLLQEKVIRLVYASGQRGIRSDRLMDKLYSHDPEGGPSSGNNALFAMIRKTNLKLRQEGYEISVGGFGNKSFGYYTLGRLQ